MNSTFRCLPLVLLAGVVACEPDRVAPDTSGDADSAAAAATPAAGTGEAVDRKRTVATSFELPAGQILSIRLQPTTSTQGKVAFSKLALVAGDVRTDIDLCADKRLQLVRSTKAQAAGEGCVIEFGNGSGTGWIAPADLRNLPASTEPRRLEVAASGDIEGAFRVYLDVGNGYGSRDMLQAESTPAPAGG